MSLVFDQTTQHAKDVVSGKIVSGLFVRLAAQRHLDDLIHGHERDLTWDNEAAEKAIRFFPAVLSITEGEKVGLPFTLLPWHLFVVGSIFGWKDVNGLRRFRFVWLETGKGQAKSPLMAAIGLYLLGFCGIERAEVYCIGEDKSTAKVMFADATAMLKADIPGRAEGDTLENSGKFLIRGKGDLAYQIEHPESNSKLKPIANTDSNSGPKPIAVMGDEIHEMKKDTAIETWRAAIAKKSGDPIMILGTNTPAIDQIVGTEYSDGFQKILRGEFIDDSAFAYIARVDKKDDPMNDESCWIKSLPALGITYPIENVRKQVASARISPSTLLTTKRLYFGMPVGTAGFWMSEEKWDAALGEVNENEMRGRKCHLSLDLSQKNDLSAMSAAWEPSKDGEKLAVVTKYWTRDYEIEKRTTADQINYRVLESAGEITITKGMIIDMSFIAQEVKDFCAVQDVVQLVVDSAFIQDFISACDDIGFQVWLYEGPDEPEGTGLRIVRHAQGKRVVFEDKMMCMPKSITRTEDGILEGSIIIQKNKLTTICASNTIVDADAQKNRMFDKKRSKGRIDGMVTISMAVGSATADIEATSSVYEERGALIM
ncbi:MAG: terminase [Robiginitomaculum sp.]|nr:MAG: terminase [Robiginitomaculum sp.]